jgi:hypothetical protein
MTAADTEKWVQYALIAAGLYIGYKVLTDVETVGAGIGTGINDIEQPFQDLATTVEGWFS